jgi:hypothetical protein
LDGSSRAASDRPDHLLVDPALLLFQLLAGTTNSLAKVEKQRLVSQVFRQGALHLRTASPHTSLSSRRGQGNLQKLSGAKMIIDRIAVLQVKSSPETFRTRQREKICIKSTNVASAIGSI